MIKQAVTEALAEHEAGRPAAPQVDGTLDLMQMGLEPMRVYTPEEVAQLIGTTRVQSVREIPESELPRVRRIGSNIGYLGLNVLCYIHGLPPVDMEVAIENYRQRLEADRPNVRPLHSTSGADTNGKTRVM